MKFIDRIKDNNKIIKDKGKLISKIRSSFTDELFLKKTYPPSKTINSVIPLNIFQTWHTKLLPPNMAKTVFTIKKMNPRFNHYLFDDAECEHFIATHFKPDVLNAYKKLIPGAYKADLWRYCILFIKGGIYIDIKYKPINKFRFIYLTETEHLCYDTDNSNIYNAIMVCKPKNKLCFKAIRDIVDNVNNKFYGSSFLDPTGPGLLRKCIDNDKRYAPIIDMQHKLLVKDDPSYRVIKFNDIYIFKQYKEYISEFNKSTKVPHYAELWKQRRIYH